MTNMPYNYAEGDWLTCTCCGGGLQHTAESNCAYGQEPYPYDDGFGMCRECGGTPEPVLKDDSDDAIRKKLGWAATTMYEARFDVVRRKLNPVNQAKFDACPWWKKVRLVQMAMEDGVII